jgi:hypothetical protein
MSANGVGDRPLDERREAMVLAMRVIERDVADLAAECGLTMAAFQARLSEGEALEELKARAQKAVPDLVPAHQLLDSDYPPIEFAIDPICPRREVLEWTGAHGIYKSTLALAACLSVATGRRFGGLPAHQGPAVFITAEDAERTVAFRTRAWLESVPVGSERLAATKAIRENFLFLAREHVRGLTLTLVRDGEPTLPAEVIARLTFLVRGASLVFLETAARLAEGNENENRVQAAFAQVLERVAVDSGAAVGIVRHVSKAAARDKASDSYAGRGGGALSDAVRSVVTFTRPDDADPLAPVVMSHAKASLSRPAARIRWQPVETIDGVYLRALSDDEELRADAKKLRSAIPPGGMTASDLHKHPPAGLARAAARAAMDHLVEVGAVVTSVEDRPRNKGVTVYRLAEEAR